MFPYNNKLFKFFTKLHSIRTLVESPGLRGLATLNERGNSLEE